MSIPQRVVRIFISSQGDVVEERNQARRVIESVQKRYQDVTLESVLWEDLALPATASFQETIDRLPGNAVASRTDWRSRRDCGDGHSPKDLCSDVRHPGCREVFLRPCRRRNRPDRGR